VKSIAKNDTVEVVGVAVNGIVVRSTDGKESTISRRHAESFDVLETQPIEVAPGDGRRLTPITSALRELACSRRDISEVFAGVDLFVLPTMAEPLFKVEVGLTRNVSARNTLPFDVYGIPMISIPSASQGPDSRSVSRSRAPLGRNRTSWPSPTRTSGQRRGTIATLCWAEPLQHVRACYLSGSFSSGFAPRNGFLPSGNVRSRPLARNVPSLA
jgi:hypothetical protein